MSSDILFNLLRQNIQQEFGETAGNGKFEQLLARTISEFVAIQLKPINDALALLGRANNSNTNQTTSPPTTVSGPRGGVVNNPRETTNTGRPIGGGISRAR